MADDPYSVLGLKKGATEQDVSRAFRRLAKKHHPDANPGDSSAEERFKAINAAHEYLLAKEPEAVPMSEAAYDHAYAAELERKLRERRGPVPPPGIGAKLKGALKGLLGKG
jgi:DnaJ-class molecular chaperone